VYSGEKKNDLDHREKKFIDKTNRSWKRRKVESEFQTEDISFSFLLNTGWLLLGIRVNVHPKMIDAKF
jgi:hypothetical protein